MKKTCQCSSLRKIIDMGAMPPSQFSVEQKTIGQPGVPGADGRLPPAKRLWKIPGPWGSKWELRQCPRSSRNSWWMLYAQVEQPTKNGSDSDILWPSMIIDLKICHPNSIEIRARSKDRKVLRFKGYWDDHTKYGARLYFNIHYYLADNTMEFNEVCDSGFPLRCTAGATWSKVTSNKTWKAPIDLSGISRYSDKM